MRTDAVERSLTGGCPCKAVRYQYRGSPVLSYKCHCLDCQAASGSGYVALFWGWADTFSFIAGEPRYHHAVSNSGRDVSRGFCARCGGPLVANLSTIPAIIGILAATLDNPRQFRPEYEVWTARALPWDTLDPELENLSENFTADIVRRRLASREPAA